MQKLKQKNPVNSKVLKDNPLYTYTEGTAAKDGNIVLYERVMRNRTVTTKNNVIVVDSINDLRGRNYCALNIDNIIRQKAKPSFVVATFGDKILNCHKNNLLKHDYDINIVDFTDPQEGLQIDVLEALFNGYKKNVKKQPLISKIYFEAIANIVDGIFNIETADDERKNNFVKAFYINLLQNPKTTITQFNFENLYKVLKSCLASKKVDTLAKTFEKSEKSVQKLADSLLKCKPAKLQALIEDIINSIKVFLTPTVKKLCSKNTLNVENFFEYPSCIVLKMQQEDSATNLYAPLVIEYILTELYVSAKLNGNTIKRPGYVMLDNLTYLPKLYDFNFKIDQGRMIGLKYSIVVQNLEQLENIYKETFNKVMKNFENKIFVESNRRATQTKLATVKVDSDQKISKFRLFNKPSKTYHIDLSGLKDGEGVIFATGKMPVYTQFDFLS